MATRKSESSGKETKAKKSTGSSSSASKPSKAASKKTATKKTASKKTGSEASAPKKTAAKKASAKKTSAKKAPAKKTAAKKASSKNKYGPSVGERVGEEIDAMKHGELYSGSGQKVTSRKQAIAIALSEKRREGAKVPPNPNQPKSKSTKGK